MSVGANVRLPNALVPNNDNEQIQPEPNYNNEQNKSEPNNNIEKFYIFMYIRACYLVYQSETLINK